MNQENEPIELVGTIQSFRDEIAMRCLASLVIKKPEARPKELAKHAYSFADALIKEKGTPKAMASRYGTKRQ